MAGLAAVCTLWPISSFDRWGLESTGRRHSRESETRHRSRNLCHVGRRHRNSGKLRLRPIVGQGEFAGDFLHTCSVRCGREVVTFKGHGWRRARFAKVGDRAELLASALKRIGIKQGDRVGTFSWNTQEHLEAYFAIPCMGAVLHTLNLRLFPEQLSYIVNHAADRVVIVDDNLIPLLARVTAELETVERYLVVGDGDMS